MLKSILFIAIICLVSFTFAEIDDIQDLPITSAAAPYDPNGNYWFLKSTGIVCKKFPCPSYQVSDVNGVIINLNIHQLVFDQSINQTVVFQGNYSRDVILYGNLLVYYIDSTQVIRFNIQHAYRILPLAPQDEAMRSGKFYFVSLSGIVCVTQPCPSWKANLVNSEQPSITGVGFVEPYSSYTQFDSNWMNNKVISNKQPYKAIVQANIFESTIISKAIYVNIVDPSKACPPLPIVDCIPNYVPTYTRDENRCKKFSACIKPSVCTLAIPVCNDGYNLVSIRSGQNACPQYYCDAWFLKN